MATKPQLPKINAVDDQTASVAVLDETSVLAITNGFASALRATPLNIEATIKGIVPEQPANDNSPSERAEQGDRPGILSSLLKNSLGFGVDMFKQSFIDPYLNAIKGGLSTVGGIKDGILKFTGLDKKNKKTDKNTTTVSDSVVQVTQSNRQLDDIQAGVELALDELDAIKNYSELTAEAGVELVTNTRTFKETTVIQKSTSDMTTDLLEDIVAGVELIGEELSIQTDIQKERSKAELRQQRVERRQKAETLAESDLSKRQVTETTKTIKEQSTAGNMVGEIVSGLIGGAGFFSAAAVAKSMHVFKTLGKMLASITKFVPFLTKGLKFIPIVGQAIVIIETVFQTITNTIRRMDEGVSMLAAVAGGLVEGLIEVFTLGFVEGDEIGDAVQNAVQNFVDMFTSIDWSEMLNTIVDAYMSAARTAAEFVATLPERVMSFVETSIIEPVKSIFTAVVNAIKGMYINLIDKLPDFLVPDVVQREIESFKSSTDPAKLTPSAFVADPTAGLQVNEPIRNSGINTEVRQSAPRPAPVPTERSSSNQTNNIITRNTTNIIADPKAGNDSSLDGLFGIA